MIKLPTLEKISFEKQRIFLRADLNIPLKDSQLLNDHKLRALQPTLDFIRKNNGKIILATHIGRPKLTGEYCFDAKLSTSILIPWFKKNGYEIELEADLEKAQTKSHKNPQTILLLENLRFFRGEQEKDVALAQQLKLCADVYVNDAFGSIHREDASITLLPKLYEPSNKAAGLLVHKEFATLSKLIEQPKQPFVIVLGGEKIADKIPLISSLIKKPNNARPSTIIIGGALSYTFLKAQGKEVGTSLVDDSLLNTAQSILEQAQKNNVEIVLPIDHVIESSDAKNVKTIPPDKKGVDIGPESVILFSQFIENANTIFANGTMGIYTEPTYSNGTKKVLTSIGNSKAYTVVGGGDAGAALQMFGLEEKIDFISTGGGATLMCLGSTMKDIKKLETLKALR